MDGTSKEVSSKETAEETWSSWALVIFLGIALTLLVFAIAIGFLAKMNSTAASQQRQGLELHTGIPILIVNYTITSFQSLHRKFN